MPRSKSGSLSEGKHQEQRILACVLCQKRKVRCDRKSPCTNCIRLRANCVPGSLGPRRRRFPERELLLRLRKYEHLLRENQIKFEPLHKDHAGSNHELERLADTEAQASSGGSSPAPTTGTQPRGMWQAMRNWYQYLENDEGPSQSCIGEDTLREAVEKMAWEDFTRAHSNILFGPRENARLDLADLHPDPTHIFHLWHIYLENVNPLLRVTHAPSLQGVIIEAVGNLSNIKPDLEALMFGIYCIAATSLSDDECISKFSSSKSDLLTRCQFGCQQALMNCEFLRTGKRTCLTALFFYVCSIRPTTDPTTLSSLLAITVRIARRIGIHNEWANAKCDVLEAELRRRLWWAIVLFDMRIGEMSQFDAGSLSPIWDCEIPLNLHDSDLRAELKQSLGSRDMPTESLFVVVRSAIANFIRNAGFFLDFHNPRLKAIAADIHGGQPPPASGEVTTLEDLIESKYLRHCDPLNPLHFMTAWVARFFIAKYRMLEQYAALMGSDQPPTDAQRDAANAHALSMLQCDTNLLVSPIVRGFLWLHQYYFPFPAYIQLFQDLRRRPSSRHAEAAWAALGSNYEARMIHQGDVFGLERRDAGCAADLPDSPLFRIQARLVLQAWEARVADKGEPEEALAMPRIVTLVKDRLARSSPSSSTTPVPTTLPADPATGESVLSSGESNPLDMAAPMSLPSDQLSMASWNMPDDLTGLWLPPGIARPMPPNMGGGGLYPFGWAAMHWGMGNPGGTM
ncbi:unnamed protein product [Clonostachys chloroleuca]|uniref:Zn(2)-C6 fungal-type domain-containing protein n=1 Tax=Clonostachys chloroleuca TaxID=1926264 RepID=A0AA35M573_9HYPO|nr:unnamed protein product [Clonostachys chloroleuca]